MRFLCALFRIPFDVDLVNEGMGGPWLLSTNATSVNGIMAIAFHDPEETFHHFFDLHDEHREFILNCRGLNANFTGEHHRNCDDLRYVILGLCAPIP